LEHKKLSSRRLHPFSQEQSSRRLDLLRSSRLLDPLSLEPLNPGRQRLVRRARRPAPIKQSLNNNAEQNKNAWLAPSVIEKNITIMAKPMWRDSAA
jgi:hypothetical protein